MRAQPEPAGAALSDGPPGPLTPLLQLSGINTFYGPVHILEDVNLVVGKGELVCLLGGNACGKSTTLKTALGLVAPRTGTVTFDGVDVTSRPTSERVRRGMAVVPENRRLFAPMTVLENLQIGAWVRGAPDPADLDRVFELFPLLEQRSAQIAGTLSGGEQQMVAMGRALMSRPSLMLMDEPSMGLSPRLVEQSFELIETLHRDGVSMLIVEQNANMALSIADRGYVLQTGRIVLRGSAQELSNHDELRRAYLGR
ncbi:ABC transporter ATP-binding protein [Terrabacter tumescens]|uniref:ABC transporter ATP-binding protein n=1 Tax=Terrabacter tumescens TaxID=60443 RepID=A0ABQ2I2H4_9MICO|nr:ABC transporter ATP-binding protein [Terrabacter tumescens]GGM98369.1 ABC transporter ATP-binding protein [Terrabacter tumescens]